MNAALLTPPAAAADPQTAEGRPVLHILRLYGEALNLRWHWPESLPWVNLALVFEVLGLPVQEHTRQELERCTLWPATRAGELLSFSHECRTLRCSHNGETVPAGHRLWLQDDDWIEVGLCRWSIRTQRAVVIEPPIPATAAETHEGSAEGAELPPLVAELVAQATGEETDKTADQGLLEIDSINPLVGWHDRYLHHLQFPHDSGHNMEWSVDGTATGGPYSRDRSLPDPLNSLIDRYANGNSLGEMLGQSEDIGTVLNAMPSQETEDILRAPPVDNVLHLFAPDDWRAPNEQLMLPLLSRMEHHGVALDSAISVRDMSAVALPPNSSTEFAEPAEIHDRTHLANDARP